MANLYAFEVTRFQFSLSMTLSFPQCIAFLAKLITMIGDYFRWLKSHRVQGRDDCDGLSHIQHSLPHCEDLENRGHHFNRNKQPPPPILLLQMMGNSATADDKVLFLMLHGYI